MSGSPEPDGVLFDGAQEISNRAGDLQPGQRWPEPAAMSGSPRPEDPPFGARAHSPSPDLESRRRNGAATPQRERSRSLSRDWPSPPRRMHGPGKGDGKGKMPGGDRIGGARLPSQVTCRSPFCTGRYFAVFVRDPVRPEDAELFCSRCGGEMRLDIQTRWLYNGPGDQEVGRVLGRAQEAMQIARQANLPPREQ